MAGVSFHFVEFFMQSSNNIAASINDAGLTEARRSLVLVIDFQQRLMPAIFDGDAVLRNALILAQAAHTLGIAALATEQYPQGLGRTVPAIAALCAESIEKTTFGACGTPAFLSAVAPCSAPTLLISGCEAHVCVLQTALQLQALKFDVRLVVDAVDSRNPPQQGCRAAADVRRRHCASDDRDGALRAVARRKPCVVQRSVPAD